MTEKPRQLDRARLRGRLLSAREIQCLQGAANGQTNAEIAADLWIGLPTVQRHLMRAAAKLGARTGWGLSQVTRAHTVALALQAELLGTPTGRHGDHAGYMRHKRAGEESRDCPSCHAGELAYQAQRRAARTSTKENSR